MNYCLPFIVCMLFTLGLSNCSSPKENNNRQTAIDEVSKHKTDIVFNADSAYHFIEKQVAFGPRVPNSNAHIACGDYLTTQLKQYGAEVTEQKMPLEAYDGTILNARNIIASYNTEKTDRILLFAHWDTRPYADNDPDSKNYHTPIDGANDGGSGVGVLLEIARLLQQHTPSKGIDIIFFDAEDYGAPDFSKERNKRDTWCLGAQYWSEHPHTPQYKAKFGILLDMVGGANATFYKEQISMRFAPQIVDKVWSKARELGYGASFVSTIGGTITDDHLYLNLNTNIPCIDIIDYNPIRPEGFPDTWHTLQDNIDNIHKETLQIVGQTIVEVIYNS